MAVEHFKKTLNEVLGLAFKSNNIISVAENQTVAITLKAKSDNDSNAVQYTISGGDSESFTVNTNTGVVVFRTAPDFENKPSYTFTAKAENGLKIITQTVTINITNVNEAPTITSTAPTTATEDTSYAYTPTATDVDSNTLTWSLSNKPTNMTFSPTTGEINWTPLEGITTSGEITLTVTDGHLTENQQFTITVTGVNDAPTITSTAPTAATEDTLYTYTPTATDVDNNTLTWSLSNKPTGMTFNTTTGKINWTPSEGITTSNEITLTVTDNHLTATQKFTIEVTPVNNPPVIDSASNIDVVESNKATGYTVSATDDDAIIYSISGGVDKDLFDLNSTSGVLTFKAAPDFENAHDANKDNNYTLIVQASDGTNNTTKPLAIRVIKHHPLLVIRIEFKDITFTNPENIWEQKIFGDNDGQLNHYFNEISQGRYRFIRAKETQGTENDGIITVKLDINHPNPAWERIHLFRPKLKEALDKADTDIDYSTYDINKNGSIEKDELQLLFLVAGGESASRQIPGIWAHASSISSFNDDVILNSYSVFGERHNNPEQPDATVDATIGVIAHELGHAALNLPDLYDTSRESSGIGYFGLMGAGSWGKKEGEPRGQTPTHMTAWSKAKSKFTYPITLPTGTHNNLSVTATANDKYQAYKVETGKDKEYFLIENRVGGYDLGLYHLNGNTSGSLFPGGLLILHIDDNVGHNNAKIHRMVDVEEANNPELDEKPDVSAKPTDKKTRGHVNNLFFNGNKTTFNDTSTPNSKKYDGSSSGVSISDISTAGETMKIKVIKN
ncbi:Fibronectin type III domain protein [hydrothermal vent metagenome]|uniref:Fibronectin type III domain protein n=1 Tax=hydrothermal vent metagenome TaxID=652676 RepID=A0A1W1DYW3_9ZZZZ